MIGFKKFLNEVLAIDWGGKYESDNILPNYGKPYKSATDFNTEMKLHYYQRYKKICEFGNFEIYCIDYGFYVYDKKQRRFTMYLTTYSVKNNVIKINLLGSTTYNKLKAYDFYHELIRHGYTLYTNEQSEGAQLVWSKLSKFKDVNIHGWYNGKAVNVSLSKDGDEIYLDHENGETYSDGEKRDGYGIALVAHKK